MTENREPKRRQHDSRLNCVFFPGDGLGWVGLRFLTIFMALEYISGRLIRKKNVFFLMHEMKYIELQRKLIILKYSYENLSVSSSSNMCAS